MTSAAVRNAAKTPMREHVERFWRLLETEHVRILVEIRRDHSSIPYWDSSSFPDDIAKVIADDHRALQSHEAAPAGVDWRVPDGFKLVRCEHVELLEKIAFLISCTDFDLFTEHDEALLDSVKELANRAMLDAAPAAPKPEGE